MGLRLCGVFALFLTLGVADATAGPSFHCSLKPISGTAWIPSMVSLTFADDFSHAEVSETAFGIPVSARVVQHSGTSYALSWTMPGLAVSGEAGRPRPAFRAILNTSNLKMSIQSVWKDLEGKLPRGSGRCQLDRGLPLLAQNEG
ncbi:hypothetical protein [Leisingera sp. ANG59]|uniref:hypothetical protein n=1 Tax=Leisingera sp. ANG59 TaxID=2675221 RepID=UPI00157426A7|nr:hypothetical protein [Leisingera sp. ANG59]NSY36780.1 hypothetical protein [Leisingera sp. ANG59]